HCARVDENLGALSLTLSPQELAAIEAVFPHDAAAGPRYWPEIMSTLNR
ncbi:aldo/keto reductase, partial [Salmonella enterica subsp. enterica]|nr:aldo/keto reductase [Salmonella enterica subsp. enterica]MBK0303555.1 aldo/keto reductase [Salmonella enterica subsp. enterica serovar Infantis]